MALKGEIVLNEGKEINGKKFQPGTVMAEVQCVAGFIIEDVDIGMQLQEVKLRPIVETKGKDKK